MNRVSNDIISYICQYLLINSDIYNLVLVDKRFKKSIYNDKLPNVMVPIYGHRKLEVTTSAYKNLVNMYLNVGEDNDLDRCLNLINPKINELSIWSHTITDNLIKKLYTFNNLKKLALSGRLYNVSISEKSLFWPHLSKLEELILDSSWKLTTDLFRNICQLTDLKTLRFIDESNLIGVTDVTDNHDFGAIINLKKLENLHLSNFNHLKLMINCLSKLKLKSLWIDCRITVAAFPEICKITQLEKLYIETSEDVPFDIRNLKNLKQLRVSDIETQTGRGIGQICNLTNLTHLYLIGRGKLWLEGKPFENLINLVSLKIECENIGKINLSSIMKLYQLEHLKIFEKDPEGKYDYGTILQGIAKLVKLKTLEMDIITSECCSSIFELKNLVSLHMGDECSVKDNDLNGIYKLEKLRWLNLGCDSKITNTGIQEIYKLANLEVLILGDNSQVTCTGIRGIKKLTKLKSLIVCRNSRITDYGLINICEIESVKLYWSSGFLISDNGLLYLCQHMNLTFIDLRHCPNITDDGLKHLSHLKNLIVLTITDKLLFEGKSIEYIKRLKKLELLCVECYDYIMAPTGIKEQVKNALIGSHIKVSYDRYVKTFFPIDRDYEWITGKNNLWVNDCTYQY